jgi:hypothetical protein
MRARTLVVSMVASSCAPAPLVVEGPPTVAYEARSAPSLPAAPAEVTPFAAEPLRLDTPACSTETRTIYGLAEEDPKLCDAALERCFLAFDAIQTDEMEVSIALGDAPKGFVEVRYRGLVLHGFTDLARVTLYPRTELRIAGFLRPRHVHIASASPGKLVVRGDPGPGVWTDRPLSNDVACDDLAWSQDTWEEPDQIAERLGAKGPGQSARISGRADLSIVPRGKRVATVELDAESYVTAYQTEKGARFVTLWSDGSEVFGWVPQGNVLPVSSGTGWGSSGGGRTFVPLRTAWHGYRCAKDVRILARLGGALLEVGRVPARQVFSVGGELERGLLALVVHHPRYTDQGDPPELRTVEKIALIGGAELAVERGAVRDCERRVPGEP